MNSNDALIAMKRKEFQERIIELKKHKKSLEKFERSVAPAALALLSNPGKPFNQWKSKWSKEDLEIMIQFKRGPVPAADDNEKLYNMNKQKLKTTYEKYEAREIPEPDSYQWTIEMEAELETLEHGAIEDIINDTALFRAAERDNEYLALRFLNLHRDRRKSVLLDIWNKLDVEERTDVLGYLQDEVVETDDED